jgi:hypothetical protein
MVSNIAVVAQIAGPQKAVSLLAKSVKLKQLGPIGDEIVDLLAPPEQNGEDGKPLPPEVQQLTQQLQAMQQQLQEAGEIIKTEKVKVDGQKELKAMDLNFQREKTAIDSETKIAVAELGARVERLTLFLEERARLGIQQHELGLATADAAHERLMAEQAHNQALEQAEQGLAGQLTVQANQPQPENGAGA